MINAYCKDQVTLIKRTKDKWNASTEKKTVWNCRFEKRTKMIRNTQGEMTLSQAKVYFPITAVVEHNDKVVFKGKEYSILFVDTVKGFSDSFLKVDLQ